MLFGINGAEATPAPILHSGTRLRFVLGAFKGLTQQEKDMAAGAAAVEHASPAA
jgi:hypothetical protein